MSATLITEVARDLRHCQVCDWPAWQHTELAAPIIRITDHEPQLLPRNHDRHVSWLRRQYGLPTQTAAEAEAMRRYEQYPDELERWNR